jgi:hypothetical protein
MDENEVNLPEVKLTDLPELLEVTEVTNNEPVISDAELAEIEQQLDAQPKGEIKWRHPQQVLTNKEMQILLSKKEEELTDEEKLAMKWMVLRIKNHNSTPKKVLSTKQNKLRKKRRSIAKESRKANR